MCFHGTTPDAAMTIVKEGFDPKRCKYGSFGWGFYMANDLEGTVAMRHAGTEDDTLFTVLVCFLGIPQSEDDIPVGSNMQKDFGYLTHNGHKSRMLTASPYPTA